MTVEYGADLHSSVHGSGFPMEGEGEEHRGHTPDQYKYSKSGWNLNNIPNLKVCGGGTTGREMSDMTCL